MIAFSARKTAKNSQKALSLLPHKSAMALLLETKAFGQNLPSGFVSFASIKQTMIDNPFVSLVCEFHGQHALGHIQGFLGHLQFATMPQHAEGGFRGKPWRETPVTRASMAEYTGQQALRHVLNQKGAWQRLQSLETCNPFGQGVFEGDSYIVIFSEEAFLFHLYRKASEGMASVLLAEEEGREAQKHAQEISEDENRSEAQDHAEFINWQEGRSKGMSEEEALNLTQSLGIQFFPGEKNAPLSIGTRVKAFHPHTLGVLHFGKIVGSASGSARTGGMNYQIRFEVRSGRRTKFWVKSEDIALIELNGEFISRSNGQEIPFHQAFHVFEEDEHGDQVGPSLFRGREKDCDKFLEQHQSLHKGILLVAPVGY